MNNPVYQSQYVIKNKNFIRDKIRQLFSDKNILFPNIRTLNGDHARMSTKLSNHLVKQRLNNSADRTARTKTSHMGLACTFKPNLRLMTKAKGLRESSLNEFSAAHLLNKSVDNRYRRSLKVKAMRELPLNQKP